MVKYETTIKIRCQEKIPDLRTILEGLFFRKKELAKLGEAFVYKLIEKKRIPDALWREMQKELGCTHQEYYTMLNKLRDSGMIAKVNGEWIISEQFGHRCQDMSDIWQSFVRKWRSGVGGAV